MSEFGRGMGTVDTEDSPLGFPPFGGIAGHSNGHSDLTMPDMGSDQSTAIDTDDVFAMTIDNEVEDKKDQAMRPPGGYYTVLSLEGGLVTTPTMEFYLEASEGRYELVERPRPVVRFYGVAEDREYKGKIWHPRLNFQISPVPAYKKKEEGDVDPTKYDLSHRLFRAARRAYREVMGVGPANGYAITEFLLSHPVKLNTFSPESGLIVLDITGIKG